MIRLKPTITLLLIVWTSHIGTGAEINFNRDIRPILSEHCLACHGFDEEGREADLRLDRFEDATASGAIVPGEADESELIRRIISDDEFEVMPPPETEQALTENEIELLRRWIDSGAEYEQHWAWRPLNRPNVPMQPAEATADKPRAVISAIDAFLEDQWSREGVTPVPPATPRERLRRLSFDLRGLPPSPKEVATFEQSPGEETYFEFRDRWMSELSYAEHQAVRWLDLVRWADTSGFVSDEPIASGAYRAWIIRAIADNKPFDQFSIEQIAGDLLPEPTDDQLIASGYNRIVNTNCEAGAIETEQLYKLKGEHVRAFGTVWLGMTTGCAECHDHKFDPFSARDYYSLAAFFDDLVEAGVYTPGDRREPLHYVHDNKASSRRDRELQNRIEEIKIQVASKTTHQQAEWESSILSKLKDTQSRTEFPWVPAALPSPRIVEGRFKTTTRDERTARQTSAANLSLHRHHAAELMTGFFNPVGSQADAKKDAWYVDIWIDSNDRPDLIGFQISNGKYGRLGWNTANYETYYWGDDSSGELDKEHPWSDPKRVVRIGDLPEESGWVRLRVPFESQVKPAGGKTFERCGMAWLHVGGTVGWGDSGLELRTDKATSLALGETAIRRWWDTPKNRQVYERRNAYVASALRAKPDKRSDLQQAIVTAAYREHSQPELLAQLRNVESELHVLRARALPVLVSKQSPVRKQTRLLNRGDYQDVSGPILSPAFPSLFGNADQGHDDLPLTRLDLARWLFDEENPIVARVFVNRLWHQFYGRGLSETLEDSGTQGEWPSNIQLLDWLASEFRDSGWDRNHMVRLLTSARAYQLSSIPSDDLAKRDPTNRLHARQGRFRLTAESVRDNALIAAGLLDQTDAVPIDSFFPYQPDPYWTRSDKVMYGSRHMVWETSHDRVQYQRSVYTFWKRQNIHPTMLAFDAPTRQECTAKRSITNTPGQALALLNDPIFVEAARVLATHICENETLSDVRKLEELYQRTLQREPNDQEVSVLTRLLQAQRRHYLANRDQAIDLVSIGQSKPPSQNRTVEVAAWTVVCRTVLNLHEFLTRS